MRCRNVPHNAGYCRFWTLLAAAGDDKDEILSTIVDLACAKLICNHNISAKPRDLTSNAVLAVVDVLLTLAFESRHQITCVQEAQLVASHMRTAFSIPKDREYIHSGYPSEPLLAKAVTCQMDKFQMLTDTNVMLDALKHELDSGLLDQGQ